MVDLGSDDSDVDSSEEGRGSDATDDESDVSDRSVCSAEDDLYSNNFEGFHSNYEMDSESDSSEAEVVRSLTVATDKEYHGSLFKNNGDNGKMS